MAAIEFAIFATVFLMIVAATADVGRLLFTQSQLDAAVGAGAASAQRPNATAASISAVVDNANGTGWASSTVVVNNNDSVATDCYCPTGTPGNWSWGSAVTCGSACNGGGVAGQFVTIAASTTISPLFPAFGFVQNGTINSYALVETQ